MTIDDIRRLDPKKVGTWPAGPKIGALVIAFALALALAYWFDWRDQVAQIDAEKSPHTAAMAAKLQTDEGKAAYRRRKWIAEPPNGWIKSVLGFRQFSLRGLHRVQAEFKLVCLALNLRRMSTMNAQ